MTTRTITLTGRPPVRIDDDAWPVIASAADNEYDGQHEFQTNRKSAWWIKVRRHADSRTIVYAGYTHDTAWQGERGYSARRGVLLTAAADQAVCDAIRDVADDMAAAEHADGDAERWPTLAAECIADMPAETLD